MLSIEGGWGRSHTSAWGKGVRERDMKKTAPHFLRVDGTQVLKQGSDEWLTAMHGSDRVYNIEVEKDNTYLVDGIVVHNCHHALSFLRQYSSTTGQTPKYSA